jgi:hypothetical protein
MVTNVYNTFAMPTLQIAYFQISIYKTYLYIVRFRYNKSFDDVHRLNTKFSL